MALVTNTISEYTAAAGVTVDGVLLKDGCVSGSQVVLRPAAESTTAIQLQNAAGTNVLNVDTSNQRVGIGTPGPGAKLEVADTYSVLIGGSGLGTGANVYANTTLYMGTKTGNSFLLETGDATRLQIGSTGDFNFNSGQVFIQQSSGNVGIGTTGPTYSLSFGGNAARTIWLERHTVANTAGNALAVQAGGATAGATDKAGGNLRLYPGVSTGSAESGVEIYGCVAGASGTADRTQTLAIQVLGNKLAFFAAPPVVRQTGCAVPTDLATCITAITALRTALNNYALTTVV